MALSEASRTQQSAEPSAAPESDTVSPSIRRRRKAATLARRRRLALFDVALGALVGIVLLLIFGLAPVAIVAVFVLLACAISYAVVWRRRSRA
jgi:Flp pilus assembly protein TadB